MLAGVEVGYKAACRYIDTQPAQRLRYATEVNLNKDLLAKNRNNIRWTAE